MTRQSSWTIEGPVGSPCANLIRDLNARRIHFTQKKTRKRIAGVPRLRARLVISGLIVKIASRAAVSDLIIRSSAELGTKLQRVLSM